MAYKYNLDFPFLFSEIDIADNLLYLVVSHLQAWSFYYVLPVSDGQPVSLGKQKSWYQQHYKWDGVNHRPFYVQDQTLQGTSYPIC